MSKIIIVSIRVAQPDHASTGGLAVAIEGLFKKKKTKNIWLGWSGQISTCSRIHMKIEHHAGYIAMTFDLSREQYESFYYGYANNCLWPAFHYRLDLMQFSKNGYHQYLMLNLQMAYQLKTIANSDDLIWVQDYHLIPLAFYCRQLHLAQPIGLFLHTPFPPLEIIEAIPKNEHWIPLLFNYDVIGVQSTQDCDALKQCLEKNKGTQYQNGVFKYKNLKTRVNAYPISIDTALIQQMAEQSVNNSENLIPNELFTSATAMISVDRLDYTKGLAQRLRAFNLLLEKHPELHQNLNYIQIAADTRTELDSYRHLRQELQEKVEQINTKYMNDDWIPVVSFNSTFSPSELMGLFRQAKVGFITPLRDGMNLVAKEYVAAQDPEDPGVLVLSKLTGAAKEFQQGALLINPFDTEDTADALFKALKMPLAERKIRHCYLLKHLKHYDLQYWCDSFLADLSSPSNHINSGLTTQFPREFLSLKL